MKEIIRRCKPIVQVEVWQENEMPLLQMFKELGYLPYKLAHNKLVLQKEGEIPLWGDYIFIYL
jgi:hypothetical protein